MNEITTIMSFLKELEQNNNKEWFHAHKKEYQEAKDSFLFLLNEIMARLAQVDPYIEELDAKDLTFRLNRDTRFSNDKSPYSVSFKAHIGPKGKLPIPCGYFINIQPNDNTIIGGGIFADGFKEVTTNIRNAIVQHEEEFLSIIHEEAFKANYEVLGMKLKKVPKEYEGHEAIAEYLKHKSWFIEHHIEDQALCDNEAFLNQCVHLCLIMRDFNTFLNDAVKDFTFPKRP